MEKVRVKGKYYFGHPWIYSKKVVETGDARPGDSVLVYTTRGKFVGSALFNPNSTLALRVYSSSYVEFDYPFIKERIFKAREYRESIYPGASAYRVVFGESDYLPGLIVDKYGDGLVFQIFSLGVEKKKREVINALVDVFNPAFIYEKNDSLKRNDEGLQPIKRLVYGELSGPVEIEENGIKFLVDIENGQKTGFFLDQRENRAIVRKYAKGVEKALDLYSYTGGFTLNMLQAGAERVFAVDRSSTAIKLLEENVKLNGFDHTRVITFHKEVDDFLNEMLFSQEKFDLIIVDPPAFTHKRRSKENAIRGYIGLHDGVLRVLKPGGVVFTFSCSQYVGEEDLLDSFYQAARNQRRQFYVLEKLIQAKDHPILTGFPESFYLKGFVLKEVL